MQQAHCPCPVQPDRFAKEKVFKSLMQFPLQGVVKGGGCVQSGRERTIAAALLSHRLGLRFAA